MEEGAEDISFKLSVSLSLDQREDVAAMDGNIQMDGNIRGGIATSACFASCGFSRSATQYPWLGSPRTVTAEVASLPVLRAFLDYPMVNPLPFPVHTHTHKRALITLQD
jgi:hypothetical protein